MMAIRITFVALLLMPARSAGQEPPPPPDPADGEEEAPLEGADEGPPRSRLDELVVTATRGEDVSFDLPYFTHTLSGAEAFGRRLSRTTTDALAETPGVSAQKTAFGQGSPFLRGFTGFRTLLLVDGVRLNNSTFRDGPNQYWNTVDAYSLDRIELVKGPASVLYGSDAIGGTLNAITRGRPGYDQGWLGDARTTYRYASAERSHVGRLEAGGSRGEEAGLDVGVTWKEYGDYSAGRHQGLLRETGYDEIDGDLRLEVSPGPHLRLVSLYQHVEQDSVPRTHKTVFAKPWHGTTVGTDLRRDLDQQRDLAYLQLHWEETDLPVETVRASLSYQRQEEERFRMRGDLRRDRQGVTVGTVGLWALAEVPSPLGRFTLGADYYHDEVDSFRKEFDATGALTSVGIQGPVGDDARYDLLGLYLQDDVELLAGLRLVSGLRYTHAAARAGEVTDPVTGQEISISDEWDHLGGSLRGVYTVLEGWNLFAGASQGFRAPNLSDLTRLDTARTNEIETPSPGLDPERYLSLEVGSKERAGFISAQVSYHYTFIREMIVRYPTGVTIGTDFEVQKENLGDGYLHGVEAEAEAHLFEGWSLFGGFSWTEGSVDTYPTSVRRKARRPVDRVPPLQGLVGLRWRRKDGAAWGEAYARMAGKQDQLSPRDEADTQRIPPGGTPGYVVLGIRGGIRLGDRLGATLAIENLTDRDYRIHGSGQNEPGTNVIVSLELRQ